MWCLDRLWRYRLAGALLSLALCLGLSGCGLWPGKDARPVHDATIFKPATKSDRVNFMDAGALAELEAQIEPVYRVGAGDTLALQVVGRPEISGKHLVGPDGIITVPVAGSVKVDELTREEAAAAVRKSLERFYADPTVLFGIELYTSHRVTVLGRVQVPGQLSFDKPPYLLEVLAKAGSLPVIDKQATLTRCAIFRGRNQIIWVDLKRLLNGGDTAYNVRLARNDVVYIPDSSDTMVYVLGAVNRPGAYRLTPDMSVMDALSQAGGANEDGDANDIGVFRPSRQLSEPIRMRDLITGARKVNFGLEEGDVIYVPKTTMANFGYITRQFAGGLSIFTIAATMK